MASSGSRRLSQAPPPNVNLYCHHCDSQIGIFDNQWIRLTSSYARAKDRGTHFGTEVGHKTQTVPIGAAQRAAEGCQMAEVFCKKCSYTVGQFCKSAPDVEKQHMVDCYFYKLSRTYLKDAQTSLKVDPLFGYGGEILLPPPRPTLTPQGNVPPPPRWSQTPLPHNRTSSQTPVENGARQSLSSLAVFSTPAEIHSDNLVMDRLAELERRVASQENAFTPQLGHSVNSSIMDLPMDNQIWTTPGGPNSLTHQDQTMMNQNSQISTLAGQLEELQKTLKGMEMAIQGIRSDSATQRLDALQGTDYIACFEMMLSAVKEAQSSNEELRLLRKENKHLKAKFSTIATAIGIAGEDLSSLKDGISSGQGVKALNVSGKRKWTGDDPRPSSLRLSDTLMSRESRIRESFDAQDQIPTPQSSGPSNDESESSPTGAELQRQDRLPPSSQQTVHRDDSSGKSQSTALEGNGQPDGGGAQSIAEQDYFTSRVNQTMSTKEVIQGQPTNSHQALIGLNEGFSRSPSHQAQSVIHRSSLRAESFVELLNAPGTSASSAPVQAQLEPEQTGQDAVGLGFSNVVDFSDDEPLLAADDSTTFTLQETSEIIMQTRDSSEEGQGNLQDSRPNARERRRRITEPVKIHTARSMAPSIAPADARRRRTLASIQPPVGGIQNVEIFTPDDIRQKLARGKKVPKKPVQTTEKLLNHELEELGLTQWIGKEKNNAEYRAAIQAARARHREAKKVATLASKGLKAKFVPPAAPATQSSTTAPCSPEINQSSTTTADANHKGPPRKVGPLTETKTKQGKKAPTVEVDRESDKETEKIETPVAGMLTRRQQRQEEIRKRDQMAKEAMEREEMV